MKGRLQFPRLFQAGMGAGVSRYWLSRKAARLGALGIVSSVGLRTIIVEAVRRGDKQVIAMAKTFPFAQHRDELLSFASGGFRHRRAVPQDGYGDVGKLAARLTVISTFIEVSLAKKGHHGKIGINVMWKLSTSVLPTILGALLAGVDALICGAGVPMELEEIVDSIRAGKTELSFDPLYGTTTPVSFEFNREVVEYLRGCRYRRPKLIPILSNYAFCRKIVKKWRIPPDFIILEDWKAGGHNQNPRNKVEHSDVSDGIETYFDEVLTLGVRVVVAGGFEYGGNRTDFLYWRRRGAWGIQVGSRFALCKESGWDRKWRDLIIQMNRRGETVIMTDHEASPTGFAIKVVVVPGTLSDPEVYNRRERSCLYGCLRRGHTFVDPETGETRTTLICPAMPLSMYQRLCPDKTREECLKECGGQVVCLCSALLATIGDIDDDVFLTLGLSGKTVVRHWTAEEIVQDILTPRVVARRKLQLS